MRCEVVRLAVVDLYHAGLAQEEFRKRFSELLRIFSELGCEVEVAESPQQLEELLIEASLLLMLGPLSSPLEDVDLLRSFVGRGRGLAFAGCGRGSTRPRLEWAGVRVNRDLVKDPKSCHGGLEETLVTKEVLREHPACEGAYRVCFHAPSSLEVRDPSLAKPVCYGGMTAVAVRESGEVAQEGFPTLAVASEVGSGRVFVVGDSDFLSDDYIVEYDNRILAHSFLSWLLGLRRRMGKRKRVMIYPPVSLSPEDDEGFYRMAWDLYTRGYGVEVSEETPTGPPPDVLILLDLPSEPTAEQVESLERFVERGGGLLVLFDRSRIDRLDRINELLERFGVRVNRTPVRGRGEFEWDPTHPLGAMLSRFHLFKPLPMRVARPAVEVALWGRFGGFSCVLAAATRGEGRVVVVGEDWPFRSHSYWRDGHYEIIRACVSWLTEGPTPSQEYAQGVDLLRREVARLRNEVEELRLERRRLIAELKAINGEEMRIETLKKLVKVEEQAKAVSSMISEMSMAEMDVELARAVIEACMTGLRRAYDTFDRHPKAAHEVAGALSLVLSSLREVAEQRAAEAAPEGRLRDE